MAALNAPRSLRTTYLLGVGLTVVALAVPAYAYVWASAEPGGPDPAAERFDAPAPSLDTGALEELVRQRPAGATGVPTESSAPLILSYHDVRPDPPADDRYTVTPQQLTDQLALLRAAGYTSIDVDQLIGWLDGDELPDRSVLVTFDDGASGLWRHADAILEAHGFGAVAFVITGRVGTHAPYYLTWDELRRMADTGRWQIESHTHLGHDRFPVDRDGDPERPFLTHRLWLDAEGRAETASEFTDRVRADLARSVDELVARGFDRPRLFAYPFSAESNPADPATEGVTADAIAELFEASTTNVLPDRLANERDRRRRALPRMEVFRSTTLEDLHRRISSAVPTEPGPREPLADPESWTDSGGEPLARALTPDVDQGSELADAARFDRADRTLTLTAATGQVRAYLAPGRSPDWADYRVATTIGGLALEGPGPTGSLLALVGSDEPLRVGVSASRLRITVGLGADPLVVTEAPLEAADAHEVAIEVGSGVAAVVVDGIERARVPLTSDQTGGIGVSASNGKVTFSSMLLTTTGEP